MADYMQVLTTIDSHDGALSLAEGAVEARLAACAQVVGPIRSVYWWDGRVEGASEWQVLLKTPAERFDALREHLEARHSYDVPEIIATPIVAGSSEYLAWVSAETEPGSPAHSDEAGRP